MTAGDGLPLAREECRVPAGVEAIVHVDCASHRYQDGTFGMHEMCFHVRKREIVALCGPNGAGKSTLVEHLNGLLTPVEGRVLVHGREIGREEHGVLWRQVGVVFQNPDDQLFAPTVLDDVMFGPLNLGLSREEAERRALEALQALGAAGLAAKIPAHLSGGQKRLVAIAGILAMEPEVIVLDEPTSDLDPVNGRRIERLVLELRERFGVSVVIATHDLEMAARIADRICLIRGGSVIADGAPAEILADTALVEQAGLVQPSIVRMYLEFCRITGKKPGRPPLREEEFLRLVARGGV